MKAIFYALLIILLPVQLFGIDINKKNITIIRDEYGVPHIYTKTDVEAAYAIAWVQCEDNFFDVQETLMAGRGLLAEETGKEGAILDAVAFIVDAESIIREKYESTFTPKFKQMIQAYAKGMNEFAKKHPKEVRNKKLFPVNEYDVIEGYVLYMMLLSNVVYDLQRIFDNDLESLMKNKPSGSNGFAVSPNRTEDGKTYMIVNSHQPLKGFAAWYELQINTEEGWNFHGATFATGITPAVGTNKNLGWTHCLNYHDFHTVYKLKMHPTKENHYYFDGEWLPLEERKLKIKVKIAGPVKLPISRKFYKSKHGSVIKNKSGYYAIRYPGNMVIGSAEQWLNMNKATNIDEFEEAFSQQQFPSMTTVYGDKDGNILFIDNGLFPTDKSPEFDWNQVIPGDTSATLWSANFAPLDSLIVVKNPDCGYVFNSNHTGFNCTCPEENPDPKKFNPTYGYLTHDNARSIRFQEIIKKEDKISASELKRMKFDRKMEFPLYTRSLENFDLIRHLDKEKYPQIAESLDIIKRWNGSADVNNKQASIVSVTVVNLIKYLNENKIAEFNNIIDESVYVEAIHKAQKHLKKHFGKIEIPLGDIQKHVRGEKELPSGGLPEVIAQMYVTPYKKGKFETVVGESFILFATYNENGIEKMETINCFGSSNRKESPHYNDQMEMFLNKEFKEMSFDRKVVEQRAERIYSPE